MVKSGKQRGCSSDVVNHLKTTNRFQTFMEDSDEPDRQESEDANFLLSIRYLFRNKKVIVRQKSKTDKDELKFEGIETYSQFKLLEEKSGKDKDLITEVKFEKTPKRLLKKCRKCNFKKRTCFSNSSMCKASQKHCSTCQKVGHYPQSLNCKVRRKTVKNCQLNSSSNLSSKTSRINMKNMIKLIN